VAAEILRSRKIHTDDTSVPVIVPGETKTKKGYFWAYCGDDQHRYSVYDFTLSHCRDGPARWLQGYCGYLQADAYGGYDGIAIQSDGRLKLVGCGAHLRRRFFAQRTLAPEVACAALAWFRQLYQWERRWKDLAEEDHYAQRQEHAVPLLGQFHDWLAKTEPRMLPKSKIGEAVSYALNQWESWVRYCDAGFLSIDNRGATGTVAGSPASEPLSRPSALPHALVGRSLPAQADGTRPRRSLERVAARPLDRRASSVPSGDQPLHRHARRPGSGIERR